MASGRWHLILFSPAYNVGSGIGELVRRMSAMKARLVADGVIIDRWYIVDDGSSDGTYEQLAKLAKAHPFLTLMRKPKNMGAARAVLGGLEAAMAGRPSAPAARTILVRLDTDLEHQPEDLPTVLAPLLDGRASVSVGFIPFDARSGPWVVGFNTKAGLEESREFLGLDLPQFCPAFIAIRLDATRKIHSPYQALLQRFKRQHSEDMLSLDFALLASAKHAGFIIDAVPLSPIEDQYIKIAPISKQKQYAAYHKKTLDFLRKERQAGRL